MATYKELVGQKVTKVSSNPGDPKTGQMWYNSSDGSLKALGLVEAFSSASPIITAAVKGAGFGPVGGPNIMFGGVTPPSTYVNTQIEYNGSGWASDGTYPQSLQGVGVTGVSTAAISVGGNNAGPPSFPSGVYNGPALEYNGSSWTSAPAYPVTSITQIANAGTETAAVFAAGYTYDPGSYTTVTNTNEYNGSSFSSGNAVNTGRQTTVSAGTQSAAIMAGGDIWTSPGATSTSNATEQYDGTSWTSVSNHPKSFSGNGFNSKSENTIINGAVPGGPDSTVFKYDGSSWSTIPGLATGRYQAASGTGSPTNVLCVSGRNPGWVTSVEEYNKSTNTVTAAAWATGGAMPTPRLNGGQGIGIQTAGAVFGGNTSSITYPYTTTTYEYDGSSWTNGGARSDAVSGSGAFGPLTAGVAFGGYEYPPNTAKTDSEEYDGSSWTNGGSLSQKRYGLGGAGILTAGMAIGGDSGPPGGGNITTVENYGGTSWTSGTAIPTATSRLMAGGTQTAAIIAGGATPGAPNGTTGSFSWNGSSWTANPNIVTGRYNGIASGGPTSQSSGMVIAGGYTGSIVSNVETWNGTSWATAPSLGTARNQHGNSQQGNNATEQVFVAGGVPPPTGISTTEEWSPETTTANIANFTTS